MKETITIHLDSARLEALRKDASYCNLTLSEFIESLHDYMLISFDQKENQTSI